MGAGNACAPMEVASVRPRRDQAVPPLWSDVFTRLQICCPDLLALGGAKRGLGAEAPCWPDRAFAVNCQLEAAAPRPHFAASRLRVNPSVGGTASNGKRTRSFRLRFLNPNALGVTLTAISLMRS